MNPTIHKALAFVGYLLKLHTPLVMPVHYHIETTSRCNLQCRFCPYRKHNSPSVSSGDMDFNLFISILEQIRKYPPPLRISLHLGGEPLLHPQIHNFVKATHEILKICPMIATNGTLLIDGVIKKLLDSGGAELIIDFSASKENFEKLRVGANWEQVLNNIRTAVNAGLDITLRNLDNDNEEKLNNLFGKYENLHITPFVLHNVGGDFAHIIEKEFNLKYERKKYNPCTHPWFGMAIGWNGDVVICCHDVLHTHRIGNLKDSTIHEIWFGKEYKKIRRLLTQKKLEQLPMCKTCSRPWEHENTITALLTKYIRQN